MDKRGSTGARAGFEKLAAAVFWLALWALAAVLVDKPLLLPAPWSVLRRLGALAITTTFWLTVARTLGRIALGLIGGAALGTLLAAAAARYRPVRVLLSPLLTIVQSTPVASFILLLLVWLGRDTLPAVVVALMVLPVVWRNVSAGVQSTDPMLLELARSYRFPRGRVLRRVYIPSVKPYFLAALETALGLAWKAGVAAEVLTVPKGSVGTMLYEAKLYLETTDLFAWTVTVIVCSLAIEKLLAAALRRLEKGGAGHAST